MLMQIAPTTPNSFRTIGMVVHLNLRRPDVELVVEFVFVCQLPLLQVNQQVRRAIAQMAASDIIFEHNKRVRWISQVVQQDLDPGVRK